jgi:cell division protein FtsL
MVTAEMRVSEQVISHSRAKNSSSPSMYHKNRMQQEIGCHSKPLTRRKSKTVPILVVCLILTLGVNIVLQAIVAQTQYRLLQQEQGLNEIDKEINRIYIELADLSSEQRIESLAQERLGMHRAQPYEIAYLPTEGCGAPVSTHANDTPVLGFMLTSVQPQRRLGFTQQIGEWLQEVGRTMAGAGPVDF